MEIKKHLITILQDNKKYYSKESGDLLLANIFQAIYNYELDFIMPLYNDEIIRKEFFIHNENIYIFNARRFYDFINFKDFLPNSYTAFKNKIALSNTHGNFLNEDDQIVLSFPFKDCFILGEQNKEEQKRQERFLNQSLAIDEISCLLAPKVLLNARRYQQGFDTPATHFNQRDNLIIKGNNLIVLSSLIERYEGKIKCIYIDPPYNTGSDSFNYNDSFNHSTWLLYMKNRLELARRLLSNDGSIFINLDYNEVHYCKVLMDEIFGAKNFQREIIWRMGFVSGYKTSVNNFIRNHDTILFYSKNAANMFFNKTYIANNDFKQIVKPTKDLINFLTKNGLSKTQIDSTINYINHTSRGQRYPLEDTWNCNKWDELDSVAIKNSTSIDEETILIDNRNFKGQKPEKLIQRIIESTTIEGDIVLDFFVGSGTTAAVAHKMNRQYIGIEQMDYIEDITLARLKRVIQGEQGGISRSVNWQGGGSFVYCELAQDAQNLVNLIMESTIDNISNIKDIVLNSSSIIPYLSQCEIIEALSNFDNLDLDDQKQHLLSIINKNKLYINLSDIESKSYNISEQDKKFNYSFYNKTPQGKD
ncbi:site-specific DNA-methyltransferase [Mycoplasmopsis mucosicanis]|uniref:Site-specific DNA-methyltransferase n=1 Tax=Mycoplasmopsis mucosicanis TaxID=458208 RepID=A0A507SVN0_9BACT|nr:site-specific DNA-methyltransferase [Mycoplasmopsis mucosicanis]TQC54235.1 site-specific DNA-methyltransferase [Mycoplasmopsis mucosicanis]